MAFTLAPLPYSYEALSAAISTDIMRLHHDKHHQSYVDKLNMALGDYPDGSKTSLEQLLSTLDSAPQNIRTALRNFGGGHYNHQLFWQIMSPNGGGQPGGELGEALMAKYGSFQAFVDAFSDAAGKLFGSGWVWLADDLTIIPMQNQDNPLMSAGAAPLMGLDVWEHAYYLDYANRRDEYIKKWWDVVDWQAISERYPSR